MKKQLQQFPQIYRFLTATAKSLVQKCQDLTLGRKFNWKTYWPFLLLTSYFLLLTFYPSTPFDRLKIQVLNSPKNAQAHLFLSQNFQINNDLENAEKELIIAKSLNDKDPIIASRLVELFNLMKKPQQLRNELEYWQKISSSYSSFRDAFLQKAALLYQLKDIEAAKDNLQTALGLDPNYEVSLRLQKLLEENSKP